MSDSPRRNRFRVTRVRTEEPKESFSKSPAPWWPSSPRAAEGLRLAIAKGHAFSGMVVEPSGTQVWQCDKCGKKVKNIKNVFEQSEYWADGIGNRIVKDDIAAFNCRA